MSLHGSSVTNAGLAHLRNLRALESLELDRLDISDAAFVDLPALPELVRFSAMETNVGDGCLQWLSGSPNLQLLFLEGTQVTDHGLAQMLEWPSLSKLRRWELGNTHVKPGMLVEFARRRYAQLQVSQAPASQPATPTQ